MVFLRIISSLIYMSYAAFRIDVEGSTHVFHEDYYQELQITDEELKQMTALQLVFESIFFVDMVTNFFKEYHINDNQLPIRSFEKISLHYLQGQFIFDAIPLIPYSYMFEFRNSRLLYFLKSIRIFKSIEMLSDKVFIKELADHNKARMLKCC